MPSIFDTAKQLMPVATMPVIDPHDQKVWLMPDERVQHIVVRGETSPEYKEWQKLSQEQGRNEMYIEAGIGRRKKRSSLISEDELEMRMLLSVTESWLLDDGEGGELEFSEGNIRKLFSDPRLEWLKDDVIAFCRNRDNYLGESLAA